MFNIEPVTAALGARLSDIDLVNISDGEENELRQALDQYLVLQIPNQSLDRFQLSKLGRRFGAPFLHPIVANGFEDCPDVMELLRDPTDEKMFGGENWHSDVTWMKPSGYVSTLHGIDVPSVGGDTGFSSAIAAFSTLSSGLQDLLRNLSAVHAYHWYENREEEPWLAEQPVVRRHQIDGREGLYINRMFTSRFIGMTIQESAPLLEYLFLHMEKHEFSCRFRWSQGDVLMWDNRFTLHYPINDFSGVSRHMIRTTCLEPVN